MESSIPKPFTTLSPEEKYVKRTIIDQLCIRVWREKVKRSGKVKRGFITNLIGHNTNLCPTLTRDTLNNALRKYNKAGITSETELRVYYAKNRDTDTPFTPDLPTAAPSISTPTIVSPPHNSKKFKGGRPKGTTYAQKKNSELAILATYNQIADIYSKERKEGRKQIKRGRLEEIIKEAKEENNLPSEVVIKQSTIRKRFQKRRRTQVFVRGVPSPLAPVETQMIATMLQLARIRQHVSPSQAISLANSMISGKPIQQELINFKEKTKSKQDPHLWGTVGRKFWYNLKSRFDTVIEVKKGQKFELDHNAWTTYTNFDQMYDEIAKEMLNANVAVELSPPVWMDREGNVVEAELSYGCQVTIEIKHPECCLGLDELGGNTSQKGDGHIGGQLLICGKGETPQKSISIRSKHYTIMGITAFNGMVVMCVIIFAGLRPNALYETGFDPDADMIGNELDDDFLEKNTGKGKIFPCGPTCHFNGKDIPCFCAWSKNGSVTSQILADILAELDLHGAIERKNGVKPFLLLDGHGSRFELPFLEYITNPDHEWVVVIGVPYGTALWQIGDSAEQNGAMNIASVKEKQQIIADNDSHFISPYIYPHDIIRIFNKGWSSSFANVATNKKAIAHRGWFPYNQNLMMDPGLRATMTKDELEKEKNGKGSVHLPLHFRHEVTDLVSTPIFDPKFALQSHQSHQQICNFGSGTAAWCLDKIVKKVTKWHRVRE